MADTKMVEYHGSEHVEKYVLTVMNMVSMVKGCWLWNRQRASLSRERGCVSEKNFGRIWLTETRGMHLWHRRELPFPCAELTGRLHFFPHAGGWFIP